MATLAQLKTQLTAVEAKKAELLATAQKYSINGSHSVEHTDLDKLTQEEARIRRKIYLFQGYTSTIYPDFGDA